MWVRVGSSCRSSWDPGLESTFLLLFWACVVLGPLGRAVVHVCTSAVPLPCLVRPGMKVCCCSVVFRLPCLPILIVCNIIEIDIPSAKTLSKINKTGQQI